MTDTDKIAKFIVFKKMILLSKVGWVEVRNPAK